MPRKRSTKNSAKNSSLQARFSASVLTLLLLAVGVIVVVAVFSKINSKNSQVLSAQTVGLFPSADSIISMASGTTNHGREPAYYIVKGATGGATPVYLKFDLSQIPRGSQITSALLKFYVPQLSRSGVSLNFYKVTGDWQENTINWVNAPAYNYGGDPGASVTINQHGLIYGVDVANQVSEWVHGLSPNYGFYIKGGESGAAYTLTINSREAADHGPTLEVTYEAPTPSLSAYPTMSMSFLNSLINLTNGAQNGTATGDNGQAAMDEWMNSLSNFARDYASQMQNGSQQTPPDWPFGTTPELPGGLNGQIPSGVGLPSGGSNSTGGSGSTGTGTGTGTGRSQTNNCTSLAITTQPTASEVADTAATIVWQTDNVSDGWVFYADRSINSNNPNDYQNVATDPTGNATSHYASLMGLLPGTTYYYKAGSTCVGDVFALSNEFSFTTTGGSSGTSGGQSATGTTGTETTIDNGAPVPPGWRQDLPNHGANSPDTAATGGSSTGNSETAETGGTLGSRLAASNYDPVSGHYIPAFGNTVKQNSDIFPSIIPLLIGGAVLVGGIIVTVLVIIVLILILRKKKSPPETKAANKTADGKAKEEAATVPTKKSSSALPIVLGCCGCGCLLVVIFLVMLLVSFGPFLPSLIFGLTHGGF